MRLFAAAFPAFSAAAIPFLMAGNSFFFISEWIADASFL
jgi:hypothetical protein